MGCGGSKQGVVAATSTCVRYRRLLRTRSGAANSHVKPPAAFRDVAGKAPAAPATAVAAVLSDVEEVRVEVDVVRMAASVEEEAGRNRAALPDQEPPRGYSTARSTDEEGGGRTCTGEDGPRAGPPEAKSNEKGGGCAGETRAQGRGPHESEEGEKMTCSRAPPKLRDAHDASKPAGVHGDGPTGEGEKSSPECNVQMDQDLRMQLQQVAEQLAGFQVWSPEDDDGKGDTEKVVTEEEKHQEQGLNSRQEEDPELVKDPVFKEDDDEDQFGDAAEGFKGDFSSRIPVYDEYPHDLPHQVPSIGCDFAAEGNAITSYLSFGREGSIDDDQIQQVLYQKFVKVQRSKPYGSGGKKRRTHYHLHQKQIRKHRKRGTYVPVR